MSGLWDRLGFRENPYFPTPIQISDEGRDLFVGRSAEVRRLLNKWDEPEGCVTVIGGHIGTGKTSFLNVCQYLCMAGIRDFQLPFDPPLLVPAFERVQMERDLTERELLARMLRHAVRSVEQLCRLRQLNPPAKLDGLAAWLDSPVISESKTVSGGVQVLGTGAQGERAVGHTKRSLAETSADTLIGSIAELAQSVRDCLDCRGIIIAIDNLELVESDELIRLLQQYRDTLFSIPGIWWVLIGQKGLYDLIQAEAPRVSQRIKGTETTLEGLSWPDFHLAVAARIELFQIRDGAEAPIGEELLRSLYQASAGEIRYVFQMADQVVIDALAEDPSLTVIPQEFAAQMLRTATLEQLHRAALTPRELRVLRKLCDENAVRPRDYKEYGFKNAPHFIQGALQPLQAKGLVSKSTQGNAALYTPRSLARLCYSFGMLEGETP